MDLNVAGLASGFDWKTMVDQLADIERSQQRRLRVDQSTYQFKNQILGSIGSQLESLETKAEALGKTDLYDSRTVTSTESHLTAIASSGTASGDYNFDIFQMATAAKQLGTSNIGKNLTATNSLATAGFSIGITAGTFTVEGTQVTIATTDTVNEVISRITTNVANLKRNIGTNKVKRRSKVFGLQMRRKSHSGSIQTGKLTLNGCSEEKQFNPTGMRNQGIPVR